MLDIMDAATAVDSCCSSSDHRDLLLPLPPNFSLQKAVCSYGFFMMAPNYWVEPSPAARSGFLERPLRLFDGRAVQTRVSESNNKLKVCVFGVDQLSDEDNCCIRAQVLRMLRLSERELSSIAAFHALHAQAREEDFGRLFRSPTLFEDMIKSLLLCNCGWSRTLSMAKALCEFQAELKGLPLGCLHKEVPPPVTPDVNDVGRKSGSKKHKRLKVCRSLKFEMTGAHTERKSPGRVSAVHEDTVGMQVESKEEISVDVNACGDPNITAEMDFKPALYLAAGAFPTPEELCSVDATLLAKRCGLGYRGQRIWKLAKDICDGTVDLHAWENLNAETLLELKDIQSKLLEISGFGPFTCANVLMCMGEYSIIPADSETVRHLKQVHGKSSSTASISKDVAALYASYAPYQFLCYWFELWGAYEKRFGKLSSMDPRIYGTITGRNMSQKLTKTRI